MPPTSEAFIVPYHSGIFSRRINHQCRPLWASPLSTRLLHSRRVTMDISPPSPAPDTAVSTSVETEAPRGSFDWLNNWFPVAWEEDVLDLKPVPVTIWDRQYVLFRDRTTGLYVVMDDVCPHRAAPLSEGRLYEREIEGKKETILECGYHGWRFGCDGKCVDIPVVPLERRIPAAADVGGIYATCVSLGGLIFVWLGDRMNADEAKVPMPTELREKGPPDDIFTMARTFRIFPISFSTITENVADPAHVPWAHHGTGQGDRNKVSREGGLDLVEDRIDQGFAVAEGQPGGSFKGLVHFQAPTSVYYKSIAPFGNMVFYLLTWTLPVSRHKSKMMSMQVILKAPRIFRMKLKFTPRWYQHFTTNLILDGDSPLLQMQEHHLQKLRPDGYGGAWKQEYTLASGSWDVLVVKLRQFFDMNGPRMPFQQPLSTEVPHRIIPRRAINDRYENHTKHCACCAPALRNLKIGIIAALVGAGISAAMAMSAGISYFALAGGGARFAILPLKLAGGGGLLGVVLLLRLTKTLLFFKNLLTYTDISRELYHGS